MTRKQLLQHLIHQAHGNGFAFRSWYRSAAARPWTSAEDAIDWLGKGSRAHLLLFSHAFAQPFFQNSGERLRYIQPSITYQRLGRDGSMQIVQRRAHSRRSNRDDVWRYHLREMSACVEPLRYIRRFLLLQETLIDANRPETTAPVASLLEADSTYDDELLVRDSG